MTGGEAGLLGMTGRGAWYRRRVTVSETPEPSAVTVSSPDLLRAARVVRGLQGALEGSLWLIVAGSVLAFGSVHAWAYSILWVACFVAAAIALARAVALGGLRQRLGAHLVAFHVSGRWLVVEPHPADRALGWSIDLREPALPRGPLLLPGLAFLALALLQLAPLAGGPATLDAEATHRGITFVLAFLLLHQAAAAAFVLPGARRRFRRAWRGSAPCSPSWRSRSSRAGRGSLTASSSRWRAGSPTARS